MKIDAAGLTLSTTVGLLAVIAAAPAVAQSEIELDRIVLGTQEDATGPVDGESDPLTVTGSKIPINVTQVPQSLTVVGRQQIERFEARRVSEALRYTAGVTTDVFGNDSDYDWLRVRGFQADQTGVFLDNAQNLSFAFGSFFIDPYTLERIEVLRGPSSALYGGSNPGGIVNYVSKRPGGRVREFTVGANDAVAGWIEFDYGDDLDADRSYRVTGRLEGGDKYDAFNDGVRGTLAPSARFVVGDGTEVTLLTNFHFAEEQHTGSTFLPYQGTVVPTAQFGFIDPDANFSDPDWDSYSRRQGTASLIVEHQFDNDFTFTGIGRVGVADVKESYWYPFGYTGFSASPTDAVGTLSLLGFEHDTQVRTAQTDLRYYGEIETGALTHDLLFGLDARYYWLDETQAVGSGSNSVINTVAPGTPMLGAPYQDAVTTQSQIGLYVQDQIRFGGGWITTLNLRHDFVQTEQDGGGAFNRHDSETSWRGALAYAFAGGFTPYVSLSSFFDPLIASPANGVTEPQSGRQVEAGFKWAPEGGNFSLAGAIFRIDQTNVVTGVFPNFDQLGEVRVQGAELEGRYDFGNGFSLAGAATFLNAEITRDSNASLVGKSPTLIPEMELSLYGEYDFFGALDGFSAGLGVRHRGESFANASNTLKVSNYTLFDAVARYTFDNGAQLNLVAANLTDERHVTGCQTEFVCSYGSGREISLSLTSRF